MSGTESPVPDFVFVLTTYSTNDMIVLSKKGEITMGEIKNSVALKNDYNRERYDRLNLMVPKGKREILKNRAKSMGMSLNKYFMTAVEHFDPEVRGE